MNNFSLQKASTKFAGLVSLVGAVSFAGSAHAENSARTAFQGKGLPIVEKFATKPDRFTSSIIATKSAETLEPKSSTVFNPRELLAQLYPVEVYKCKLTYLDGRLSRWVNRTVGSGNSFPNAQYTAEQKAGLRLQCIALSGKASFNKDWANPKGAIN